VGAGASASFRVFSQSPPRFSGSAEVTSAPRPRDVSSSGCDFGLFFLPVIVIAEIDKQMQQKPSLR
jgi:hypothetical protein